MSKNEIKFEPGSLDWLEARVTNVTATEVASLFGLNKYKSANKLQKDKFDPQSIWNPAIRRGRILEPAVLQAVREDMGWNVSEWCEDGSIAFFKHPKHRLSATPDAKIFNTEGEFIALLECKSASEARLDDWDFSVPVHYLVQVQVQMICTGKRRAYIACLGAFEPFPLVVYQIKYHKPMCDLIKKTVDLFWKMVDNGDTFKTNKEDKELIKEWAPNTITRIY